MRKVVIASSIVTRKVFPMSAFKWEPADYDDCEGFQSYMDVTGCEPLSKCDNVKGLSHEGLYGVYYVFTILRTPKGKFVPCHGGIKMPEVDSEIKARSILAMWMQKEQDAQYDLHIKNHKR
jgi:hypothetical protein